MEEDLMTPVPMKTKEKSGSVLLTYFQGDVNSMVDEHFTRALSQAVKPKGESSKMKRKHGLGLNPWEAQTRFQPMFPPEHLTSNHHMSPNHPVNPIWSGDSRQGLSLALPSVMYPSAVSSEGLGEHQYSHSLLNMLHNDRPDMSTGWTKYPGFGDQMTCDISLNSGVQVIEKKDLYWY